MSQVCTYCSIYVLLSLLCYNTVIFAVKSFTELIQFIFKIPGVKFFLSERLSQDPLENFFGCQRQRGRTGENPNVQQFCKNTQALHIINSVCGSVAKGNCHGRKQPIDLKENRPLPKRCRIRKAPSTEKKEKHLSADSNHFTSLPPHVDHSDSLPPDDNHSDSDDNHLLPPDDDHLDSDDDHSVLLPPDDDHSDSDDDHSILLPPDDDHSDSLPPDDQTPIDSEIIYVTRHEQTVLMCT